MKIHEYQAKELFEKAASPCCAARWPTHRRSSGGLQRAEAPLAVVKAQIHAGGRGKGTIQDNPQQHGVQLVQIGRRGRQSRQNLLGHKLVTIQTGREGKTVNRVFVEEGCKIARELYLGIVLDRAAAKPVLMVSSEGRREDRRSRRRNAAADFQGTFRSACRPDALSGPQAVLSAEPQGPERRQRAEKFMRALCRLFVQLDCSLCEINPLVVTESGELVALDAKITFDDNAMFRHKDLAELRDLSEEDPAEVRASNAGLSYVKLDGNIGCLVNGAGPGDEHDGHHQAARRRAGQLPRRRRRGQRAAGDRGVPHSPVRSEREGRAGQHLRRHCAARRSPARSSRPAKPSASTCRWSCGWKAPKSKKARRFCARAA